jgi:hypothetical protein
MEPNRFMVGDIIHYDLGGARSFYYLVVEVSNEDQFYAISNLEMEGNKRMLHYDFAHNHYSIVSRA